MRKTTVVLGCGLLLLAFASAASAKPADDALIHLQLLWTNDVHGHIAPEPARFMNPAFPPPLGGAASAATYIHEVRDEAAQAGQPVLLVDVGDMFQGTPIGNKTKGRAVIDYYNSIGYDFAVPGNHDFDLGRDVNEALARQSHFPWLAANLVSTDTGKVVDWCRPTLMVEKAGIKIGVIGIITPATAKMSFPENIVGLTFLPMPPVVAKYRDELRAQGADLIMLAIHEGLPYDPKKGWEKIVGKQDAEIVDSEAGAENQSQASQTYGSNTSYGGMNLMELVNTVPGIDIAVGGHTHRGYQKPWIDPVNHTMCFETFGNGSSVGHVILLIDPQTKTLVGYEPAHDSGTLVTLFQDELWPDSTTTNLLQPYLDRANAEMNAEIGKTTAAMSRGGAGSNQVGNLVTDAMRAYFDADFAFQNLGGLRADLPPGPITAGDIFGVLPFGNELVVVQMNGRLLRSVIEAKLRGDVSGLCVSGVTVVYDSSRPDWDRLVALTVGGKPWDPDATYTAVCTNFLLEGNSGLDMLTKVPPADVTPTQVRTAEAVERYFQVHSPVAPISDGRWAEHVGQAQAPYLAVPYLP